MRKFLKHFPFNKLFVSLFVILYTFVPSAQAMRVVAEDISNNEVDTSEDILDEGISDPAEIANPNVSGEEVIPEVEEVAAEVEEPLFTYVDGVYTVNKVVVDEEYVYPDNSNVRVKFTSITEEGNLVINKVLLTEEEKSLLNTSDDYGWDIRSSMTNGSFVYDLTLPNNTESNDVEVKYSEDGNTYESIDNNLIVNENVIEIKGLEHFTVFVVTTPDPVNVDCSAVGFPVSVGDKCYNTVSEAVANANNGDTINISNGTYTLSSQLVISKDLTILGEDKNNTIIKSSFDTGSEGDSRGLILIKDNATVTISGITINGDGQKVYQAIRANNAKSFNFSNSIIKNISYGNKYLGFGVAIMGTDGAMDNIYMENIQRVGVSIYYETKYHVTNFTYIGKGEGDWLDYGIEVGGGATASIQNAQISDCRGIATSDGSTSAGILATTYYGDGTNITLENSAFQANSLSLAVGYDENDNTVAFAHYNDFSGDDLAVSTTKKTVDATNNKWGTSKEAEIKNLIEGDVLYDPWYGKEVEQSLDVNEYEKDGIYYVKYFDDKDGNPVSNNDFLDFNIGGEPIYHQKYIVGLWGYDDETGSRDSNRYRGWESYYPDDNDLVDVDLSWQTVTDKYMGGNPPGTPIPAGDYILWAERYYEEGGYVPGSAITQRITIDNQSPSILETNTKMYVQRGESWEESYLTKSGDTVKISIEVEDALTEVDKVEIWVRENPWEPNHNELVYGYMIKDENDPTHFEFTYTVPDTYKNNSPINQSFEGNYFNFRPYDVLGNSYIGWRKNFTIDNTPPEPPELTGDPIQYVKWGDVTRSWLPSNSPDVDYYTYKNITSGWTAGPYNAGQEKYSITHTTGNSDRVFEWRVAAVDYAGNETWSDDTYKVVVDNTPPEAIEIISPNNEQYFNSTPIKNEWNEGEDASGIAKYRVWYSYDDNHDFSDSTCGTLNIGGKVGRCRDVIAPATSRNHMPGLNEQGGVTIRVQAIDNAGNEGEWSYPVHYYYDSISPEAPALVSPLDGAIVKGGPTQSWSSTDNDIDHYIYESWKTQETTNPANLIYSDDTLTTTSRAVGGTQNITFWWRVRAVDRAGNDSDWSEMRKLIVDNTLPEKIGGLAIYKGHNSDTENLVGCGGYTNDTKIRISWEPSPDSDIDYYWFGTKSNQKHAKVDWPTTYYDGNMTPGNNPYSYTVIAVDKAGNESPISESCELILDMEPPSAPVLESPEDPFYTKGVYFEQKWSSVEDAVAYEYNSCYNNPDEHPEGYCNLKYKEIFSGNDNTTKKVGAGQLDSHFWWRVRSKDIAGNWSDWSEVREVIIDNTNPTKPDITNTPNNSHTNIDGITINWEGGEDQGTYPSGIKGYVLRYVFTPVGGGTTTESSTELQESGNPQEHSMNYDNGQGTYEIFVKTIDNAGNESQESEFFTITYDSTAPETTLLNDPSETATKYPIFIQGTSKDTISNIVEVTFDYKETEQGNDAWIPIPTSQLSSGANPLINPSPSLDWTWNVTWTPPEDGIYDIKIYATDEAGNIESSAYVEDVTYDTTPPEEVIITADQMLGIIEDITANDSLSGVQKIEISADNMITWVEYILGTDVNLNDLVGNKPGEYTIYIRVTDNAGNTTTKPVIFTIPSPAPTTTETAGDILGVTSPLKPTPVQAYGTGGYLYSQTDLLDTEEQQTPEEETITEDTTAVKGEEDNNGEPTNEEQTTQEKTTKWWIYPLVILPLLAIFLILWKRRKEDNQPQL